MEVEYTMAVMVVFNIWEQKGMNTSYTLNVLLLQVFLVGARFSPRLILIRIIRKCDVFAFFCLRRSHKSHLDILITRFWSEMTSF